MEHTVSITASVQGGEPEARTAGVRALSETERGNRAFKMAAICAAIGMGSVLIPVVHFFLPWIMLIVTVVVYTRIRGQRAVLLETRLACPACGDEVTVPQQALTWPIEHNCPHCRKRIELRGPEL